MKMEVLDDVIVLVLFRNAAAELCDFLDDNTLCDDDNVATELYNLLNDGGV